MSKPGPGLDRLHERATLRQRYANLQKWLESGTCTNPTAVRAKLGAIGDRLGALNREIAENKARNKSRKAMHAAEVRWRRGLDIDERELGGSG